MYDALEVAKSKYRSAVSMVLKCRPGDYASRKRYMRLAESAGKELTRAAKVSGDDAEQLLSQVGSEAIREIKEKE